MTPQERAEKIVDWLNPTRIKHTVASPSLLEQKIANEIESAVEEALAKRDLEQFGESFTLNGKRIGPNEIYKSTTDYVREARTEALEEAAEIAEDHNGCVDIVCLRDSNCGATIANQVRALIPKDKP